MRTIIYDHVINQIYIICDKLSKSVENEDEMEEWLDELQCCVDRLKNELV